MMNSNSTFSITNALVAASAVAVAVNFKFLVRKLLLALGYPKLQVLHPQLGVYEVGSIMVRLSEDLPATQLFYPVRPRGTTAAPTQPKKQDFVPYFRPCAVQGFADFLKKLSNKEGIDWILQMLQETPHPLLDTYGADPIASQKKFPLVLMSHGLGGSMEMYTELCSQMASLGTIVVAPEHQDTSGCYARKSNGDEIYFAKADPSTPDSRQKVQELRGPGIDIRVNELTAIYDHILEGWEDVGASSSKSSLALAQSVLATSDPLRLHLVGHCLGGATQLVAAQKWAADRALQDRPSPILPLSVTVCDAWTSLLTDEQLATGIPSHNSDAKLPILSVLSEEWTALDERWTTQEFLASSRAKNCNVESYCARHSVHNSFSDAEAWFPTPVARVDGTRGQLEERHATLNAVVASFAKLSGLVESIDDQPLLVPVSIDETREESSK